MIRYIIFLLPVIGIVIPTAINAITKEEQHISSTLLNSIMLERALYVAASLQIADHLLQPSTAQELAEKTTSHAPTLERLLFFLSLNGIFDRQQDGTYALNQFSHTMCSNHPASIRPFLLHNDETRWHAIGHLEYSIKTGHASFDMLYNESYFEYLQKHPTLQQTFDVAMTVISAKEDKEITKKLSFYGNVVDIGGGKGQLLTEILSVHEINQALLFDLPEVVQQIDHPKIHTLPGSFFEPISLNADIYILKRVLHDWSDQQALSILSNIQKSMSNDSILYIIDGLLDRSTNKKLLSAIDLGLLTIFQGKERTFGQLKHITQAAGLEIINVQSIDDLLCVVTCKKMMGKNSTEKDF